MEFDIRSASPSIPMWRLTYVHSTVHLNSEEHIILYKAVNGIDSIGTIVVQYCTPRLEGSPRRHGGRAAQYPWIQWKASFRLLPVTYHCDGVRPVLYMVKSKKRVEKRREVRWCLRSKFQGLRSKIQGPWGIQLSSRLTRIQYKY